MRTRPLVYIPQHFGALVFDRRSSRYSPFDTEAAQVLRELRLQDLSELAKGLPSSRQERLADFYSSFQRRGFFDIHGRFDAELLPATPPEDHLLGPLAVHLELIAACNLQCSHCFAGALPRRDIPLSLQELDGLFEELASLGSLRLGLTGGEPLMRQDIFEILDLATTRGLHPCLTSNGLLITEAKARELGRRELVWLNISLDGASKATNDLIRGPGVFEAVMEKLAILRRHARFTLAFTIMKSNLHEIEDCARLAQEVGAHNAVFRPLYPTGTALQNLHLMPSFAEYSEALSRLARMQLPKAPDFHGIDPFSPQARKETQARIVGNMGCGAGNLVCSISVSGQVNPCGFLGPEQEAGSLRRHPFRELWDQSAKFRAIRALPGAACGAEEGFAGGCRARALSATGDIDGADPWQRAHARTKRNLPIHPNGNLELSLEGPHHA